MENEEEEAQQLLKKIADLERILSQKQLSIDYLEKLVEVGGKELKIDLKKRFADKLSNESGKKPKSE